MSAHVLLNLLNKLRKRDIMRGLPSILSLFFATSLITSIVIIFLPISLNMCFGCS